jgi:catechol 2,3-dioxygenase-like lactoylglutathione lyase family enzyme
MNKSERRVKALGEVSIRVKDLDVMQKFYEKVVGLEVLRREKEFVFFRIADGYGGHSQVLALFPADNMGFLRSKSVELIPEATTLHHIALNVALDDFESERRRLEGLGVKVEATTHAWIHVRSMYFPDPEGNLLEFVSRDDSVE